MKARLALFVAIVLGGVAAYGVRSYLQKEEQKIQRLVQPVKILTAKRRIPKGTTITPDMIGNKEVSSSGLTRLHMLERDALLALNMRSNRDIERGSPLTRDYFEQVKLSPDRDEEALPKGYRAVTVSVDSVSGVAGNIRPGSHVDIFGTFDVAETKGGRGQTRGAMKRTVQVLANVRVLATDNRTTATQYALGARRQGAVYSTITVAVTPEEAMLLIYGQNHGKLALVLRNALDVLPGPKLKDVDESGLYQRIDQAKELRRKRSEEKATVSD